MSLRRPRFEDEEPASAINISPLIDVIFILLIFFIVTMVFAENDAMGVDAPRASNSQSPDSSAAVVSITSDGSVAIGRDRIEMGDRAGLGKAIALDEVDAELVEHAERGSGKRAASGDADADIVERELGREEMEHLLPDIPSGYLLQEAGDSHHRPYKAIDDHTFLPHP